MVDCTFLLCFLSYTYPRGKKWVLTLTFFYKDTRVCACSPTRSITTFCLIASTAVFYYYYLMFFLWQYALRFTQETCYAKHFFSSFYYTNVFPRKINIFFYFPHLFTRFFLCAIVVQYTQIHSCEKIKKSFIHKFFLLSLSEYRYVMVVRLLLLWHSAVATEQKKTTNTQQTWRKWVRRNIIMQDKGRKTNEWIKCLVSVVARNGIVCLENDACKDTIFRAWNFSSCL